MTISLISLTLSDARIMIAAGEAKAGELGIPYNLAVVDAGGNLISHVRMDGAWIGSIDVAINKAYTSRCFDMATADLAAFGKAGGPAFGIHTTNHQRVVIFGGGVPIRVDGKVVGAFGASGGSVDQDVVVALAAASAFS
jgi:uncharacterized protein GlcG (DUF336 family)